MKYKSVFNIIKNYHWQSLFFKYWKILATAFAVPMIIFFFTAFSLYSSSQQSEFDQSFAASAFKSKSSFELLANNFENFHSLLMSNSYVLKYLNQANPEPADIDRYEIHNVIKKRFNELMANHPYINSIYLYSSKSDYIISTQTSDYRNNFVQKDIIDKYLNGEKSNLCFEKEENGEKISCLAAAYPLCLNYYDKADGILIINIDLSKLAEFVSAGYIHENILLFTKDADPATQNAAISDEVMQSYAKTLKANIQSAKESNYFISREKSSVLCFLPLEGFDVIMALQIPSEHTKNLIDSFALTIFVLVVIMLLVILAISFYTSLIIYRSIANIVSEIGINTGLEAENVNEASFISDSFLSVLKNNSEVEKELTEKVLLLKKSQTLALQTQINPHFIFNTLNLVSLMIIRIAGSDCAPSQIISLLTDIMYYSFKTDKFITNLDEELSYTQKYIQIEQIKYNNKFDYEFFVEDSIRNCKTVKFSLQPIIENCVEHGLKKLKDRKGKISVYAIEKDGRLHITIRDNGMGITPEKLEELNKKLNSDEIPTGKHIGLANVNQRIQLIFGSEYGIKVNALECGLEIELTQPISR